ncbi:DUF3189 family protein [Ammoniphilus sp. YIM 78166]|uniref:DUF3189 family protein n=1 Tax=Ammoniphilus sp. YIM 78166 TaxID=1644106 RepID=UPI00106F3955|nr:DUF3189 family protein [Ammoniphilus sp. YIM 78166]
MNIVYCCYGSAHSSIIAAHVHLGFLPMDRIPSKAELLSLYDFDRTEGYFIGSLFYKGVDEWGNRVYTMGLGREMDLVRESFLSMLERNGGHREQYRFFLALPHINRVAKIGGALSRRYGWVGIGRPLAVIGIRQSYPGMVRFVKDCKRQIEGDEEE